MGDLATQRRERAQRREESSLLVDECLCVLPLDLGVGHAHGTPSRRQRLHQVEAPLAAQEVEHGPRLLVPGSAGAFVDLLDQLVNQAACFPRIEGVERVREILLEDFRIQDHVRPPSHWACLGRAHGVPCFAGFCGPASYRSTFRRFVSPWRISTIRRGSGGSSGGLAMTPRQAMTPSGERPE